MILRVRAIAPVILTFATFLMGACRARADQAARSHVAWRQLGSWSGHGNAQTDSFDSETGALRVRWELTPQPDDRTKVPGGPGGPGAPGGSFRLVAHSAISGRPLQPVVEHAGAGSGVGYVQQDPHVFYMVVESTRLNWTFTVEEAIGYP